MTGRWRAAQFADFSYRNPKGPKTATVRPWAILISMAVGLSCSSLTSCRSSFTSAQVYPVGPSKPPVRLFTLVQPSLRFNRVHVLDPEHIWVVGEHGTIMASRNGGRDWLTQERCAADDLEDIRLSPDKAVWAAGSHGVLIRSTDNGATWRCTAFDRSEEIRIIELRDDRFLVFAGGWVLSSLDRGRTWKATSSSPPIKIYSVRSIHVTKSGREIGAVGDNGDVFFSSDAGTNWKTMRLGHRSWMNSIAGSQNAENLWTAGTDGEIFHSADHAKSWETQISSVQVALNSIYVDSDNERVWIAGDEGTILYSPDRGKTWQSQSTGVDGDLISLDGCCHGTLFAVGSEGTIIRSRDGGPWTIQRSPATEVAGPLRAIKVISDLRAWAVGYSGNVIHTEDGGHTWITVTVPSAANLWSVNVRDSGRVVWATGDGGTLVQSVDGGYTWRVMDTKTRENLTASATGLEGPEIWSAGLGGSILQSLDDGYTWHQQYSNPTHPFRAMYAFPSLSHICAVALDGVIVCSADKGVTWTESSYNAPQPLWGISGDPKTEELWAVGDRGLIIRSFDGGTTWVPQTSPSQDDLHAVSIDEGLVIVVGEGGSAFISLDRAQSWFRQVTGMEKLYAANDLYAVDTLNNKPWVVGDFGTPLISQTGNNYPHLVDALVSTKSGSATVILHVANLRDDKLEPLKVTFDGATPSLFKEGHIKQIHGDIIRSTRDSAQDELTYQLDPAKELGIVSGMTIQLRVTLESGNFQQRLILSPFEYAPSAIAYFEWLLAYPVVLMFVLFYLLAYAWPGAVLVMHERVGVYDFVDQLPSSGWLGMLRPMFNVLLFPTLFERKKILDAWIIRHVHGFAARLEAVTKSGFRYVALPIRHEGTILRDPTPADLRNLLLAPRSVIEITGPGGAGKTTLALQLARWAMSGGTSKLLTDHIMLPVVVDTEFNDLIEHIRGLVSSYINKEVSVRLIRSLLRQRRILVIVDGFSERTAATQRAIISSESISIVRAMIVTSRTPMASPFIMPHRLEPQSLDSRTLLHFITGLLPLLGKDSTFPDIQSQTDVAARFGRLFGLADCGLAVDVPITPLLITLYMQQAVAAMERGCYPRELPISIPGVFIAFFEAVNSGSDGPIDGVSHVNLLKAAGIVADECLRSDFVPREIKRDEAELLITVAGWHDRTSAVHRLIMNGILVQRTVAGHQLIKFAMDPMAEHIGAWFMAGECAESFERWELLWARVRAAPSAQGFEAALKLTWTAYGRPLHWIERPPWITGSVE